MMRKLIGTVVIVGICLFVAKKVNFFSYAGTLWSQAKKEARLTVPTRFEIERIRHEIAALDGDINRMIRPVAENVAAIKRLKVDIEKGQARLDEQRGDLLTMTRDLENNATQIVYGGQTYSAERVKAKLDRDLASFKRLEANLQSQTKLLDAKEKELSATQEQLSTVIAKKREFEVQLAQLEAEAETLQISKIGSKPQIDDSRATHIAASLSDLRNRLDVETTEIELANGSVVSDNIPVNQRSQPKMDLNAIRAYLEGKATTASNGK